MSIHQARDLHRAVDEPNRRRTTGARILRFRKTHPTANDLVVAPNVAKPSREVHAGLEVQFLDLDGLIARITAKR